MTIVVDANIIISGIINPYSLIGVLLIEDNPSIEFVIPEFALIEIQSHKERICKKLNINSKVFEILLDKFLLNITVFGHDDVTEEIYHKAEKLTQIIDTNDTWYIAFAIALNGFLWTGDLKLNRGLRKKACYLTITTQEFSAILKGI
jgi:predicted nucleic acid-binding protein